jgi:TusA-related sulfurtransferase
MTPAEASTAPVPVQCLDLRGTLCPVNFVRTRLALEKLPPGAWLQVDLDAGAPESLVSEGLREEGHEVLGIEPTDGAGARLLICRAGA